MKKIICKIAAVALLLGVSTAAQAQTVEDNYPYNFITVQGGVQGTTTNYDFTKLLTPPIPSMPLQATWTCCSTLPTSSVPIVSATNWTGCLLLVSV